MLPTFRDSYDMHNEYVVCRITVLNDTILVFEPDISLGGIKLESRYGIYSATVTVNQTTFDAIPPLPTDHVVFLFNFVKQKHFLQFIDCKSISLHKKTADSCYYPAGSWYYPVGS